jgi:hypothetical protein
VADAFVGLQFEIGLSRLFAKVRERHGLIDVL